MKVSFVWCVVTAVLGISLVSASYHHTGYHKKGKKCYQCAWSPPKVAYATVKKALSYGSGARIYGKSLGSVVNYGLKKVPVKVKGGWDKCHDAFNKYQADRYGIDQWECEHNCYTRTDKNGNLYRGCYKGEYNVNPHKLGCHYQAGSLYCFCAGELCNNKEAPRHKDYAYTGPARLSYGYAASSPKSNYGVLTSYDFHPKTYRPQSYGYNQRSSPYDRKYGYNYGYLGRPSSYKKAASFEEYDSEPKYSTEKKSSEYDHYDHYRKYDKLSKYGNYEKEDTYEKDSKYDKYGDYKRRSSYEKDSKYGKHGDYKRKDSYEKDSKYEKHGDYKRKDSYEKDSKYDRYGNKGYDSFEYDDPKFIDDSSEKSSSEEQDYEYGVIKGNPYVKYASRDDDSYTRNAGKYDSYEDQDSYETGFERYKKLLEKQYGKAYLKSHRFPERVQYLPPAYKLQLRAERPIKHYIHPIKALPLNKHR